MAQVSGQFEVKQFYRDSISNAFQADKVRLAAAVFGGLVGYGLLRRLGVHRFTSLSVGSAPVIAYAAYSLHRAQAQQKAAAALRSPISTLPEGDAAYLYRMVLLHALPEEAMKVAQHPIPNDREVSQEVITALFTDFGWEKDQVGPSTFGEVVAAIRLLHDHRERLPLLQRHLHYDYLQGDGSQLLRGGRTDATFDYQVRNREIKAAIAPGYEYTQICPDRVSRVRKLHPQTHLQIFAWLWRNVSDEAKERMTQGVQCPLLVRQELGYGVLPQESTSRYSSPPTISREATIAFLAMKGRPPYFSDDHKSFSVASVALAGLILDLRKGEGLDQPLNLQELKDQLIASGVNEEVFEGYDNPLREAAWLIQLGVPTNP